MFRKRLGRRRKPPIPTMIRHGNSVSDGRKRNGQADLEAARENRCEFLRRNYLELSVGALAGLFVGPPSAEMRHVTEAASLHMLVSNFYNQFGSKGSQDKSLPWLQRLWPPGMRWPASPLGVSGLAQPFQ